MPLQTEIARFENPEAPAFSTAEELLTELTRPGAKHDALIYMLAYHTVSINTQVKHNNRCFLSAWGVWENAESDLQSLVKLARAVRGYACATKTGRSHITEVIISIPPDEMRKVRQTVRDILPQKLAEPT